MTKNLTTPKSATTTLAPEPGSVIHGTHRPQDLIPAFLQFWDATGKTLAEYNYAKNLDDDDEWWDSEMCNWFLHDLFERLNDIAPTDHYFGAHPGDGSDFGFWPCTFLE